MLGGLDLCGRGVWKTQRSPGRLELSCGSVASFGYRKWNALAAATKFVFICFFTDIVSRILYCFQYARHTVAAQYLYALLGPPGLRVLTPLVVWVELLAAPTALLGSFLGSSFLIYLAVILISSLHVGIALTLRNSALLSFVACVPWAAFLPLGWRDKTAKIRVSGRFSTLLSIGCIGAMVAGCMWLETISQACDQSVKHIWSTLLHNRWNVFVGAEEYVTWEIAPGQLRDGSIVDVWGRRDEVLWDLPGGGAPCKSTCGFFVVLSFPFY